MYRLTLALLLAWGATMLPVHAAESRVGSSAPGFELNSLSGQAIRLQALTEQGAALLVFWSTRCEYCHAMIPEFKRVHREYGPKGIRFVAINVGYEDRAEVVDYANQQGLDYLILNEDDKKADIAQRYGLIGTPTIVLVDSDGIIRYRGHQLPELEQWLPKLALPDATTH